MKYIMVENGNRYDVYMVNSKTGARTFDCSFNIKEKAIAYVNNMNS